MIQKQEIGPHTLYCGDWRSVGVLGDCTVTDPPYGINYKHGGGGKEVFGRTSVRRHMKPIHGDDQPFDPSPFLDRPFIAWGANHFAKRLPSGGSWLSWDKAATGGPEDSFVDCEFAWCSIAGIKRNIFRYTWKGVCQSGEKGLPKYHPSQKPIALMKWCLSFMDESDVVFDPYMGSGSTGVACEKLGRRFIGCETDHEYFDIACRRIEAAMNEQPLLTEACA